MIPRFHFGNHIVTSPLTIAMLSLVPAASYVYAFQSGTPVPAGLKIPQSGSFVATSGNQYSFSGSAIMVTNTAAGMTSLFRVTNGKIFVMSGGMDVNRMLAELQAHQESTAGSAVTPQTAALPTQTTSPTPRLTSGADGSYSVALADGSTVTFLNKGTRVEVANPAVTFAYTRGVTVIALQYVSGGKSIVRSLLSYGGGSDGAAASPNGTWESADLDPRAGGFSEEAGPVYHKLVPAYMHTVSSEILDAMKVAKDSDHKVVGEAAMTNLYKSPYVGGRNGGTVLDHP